ncbi:MAG TPA: uroporphyrinogen decarboxylase family protein [Candidatus Lokiarchaeia archaeon]|nr:uroporphyrinogen decarboxylase family protein [Candidatus Lokiarchaeia archaeon]
MNARDRITAAFNHEEGDRVPTFLQSMMPIFEEKVRARFEDEVKDEDILYIGKDFTMYVKLGLDSGWGAPYASMHYSDEVLKNHPFPDLGPNRYVGHNGRITERGILNGHQQSWNAGSILKSVDEAEEWYSTYIEPPQEAVPNAVEQANQMLRSVPNLWERFVPVAGLPGNAENLMEGLGMSLFARMLRKHRDKLHKYMRWWTRDAVEQAKIAVETDYFVFNIADDTAYKQNTMLSPADHRELVMPYYKQVCDVVRKAGKNVFFHSDGFTEPYFPNLIEAGFHGIESLEPNSGMNLKHLKETYGDQLCLIGNIDVSTTLPLGTPGDVAKEVKQCIKDAAAGGGYIVSPCTDFTDAVPLENALAMTEAVKKFGVYRK